MAKFVCVRIVQGWGIDLNNYQFDYRQTWAAFFMNPDKTIYGRYGTESTFRNSGATNTLEGFKLALKASLDLHAGHPGNKTELAAKTGPPAPWRTPETIPFLQGKPPSKAPYAGKGTACIHCHAAWGGVVKSLEQAKQPVPLKLQAPWPMPDVVGLDLDPREKAKVTGVDAGSAAEKAGFKAGDVIVTMEGQPIVSIADVQWVLHNAKDSGPIKLEVERSGQKTPLTLTLAGGWRNAAVAKKP